MMKNVLLLGDSIRLGYCKYVKKELKGIAEVSYPDDNCRYTQYTLVSLPDWVRLAGAPEEVDVIHWNNGHWDVAHWNREDISLNSPEQYRDMLERIYHRLCILCPNAKIIFALTTSMNPDGSVGENPRTNSEIERYNSIAREVMGKLDVEVNDLYSVVKDKPSSFYIDYAHFTENGYELLGKTVAKVIKANL
jgi:lysophospholipase L1-like esterase